MLRVEIMIILYLFEKTGARGKRERRGREKKMNNNDNSNNNNERNLMVVFVKSTFSLSLHRRLRKKKSRLHFLVFSSLEKQATYENKVINGQNVRI